MVIDLLTPQALMQAVGGSGHLAIQIAKHTGYARLASIQLMLQCCSHVSFVG